MSKATNQAVRASTTPGIVRGRPRSEQAHRAILEAALDLLAEHGMSGLTMDGVAAKAGVGKRTVYRRWRSKLPLAADALMTAPQLRIPATGTFQGDLRKLLGDIAKTTQASPLSRALVQLVAERGSDPVLDLEIDRHLAVRRRPTLEVLQRGAEQGGLRPDIDLNGLADILAGAIVYRRFYTHHPIDAAFVEFLIDTVLHGAARQDSPKIRGSVAVGSVRPRHVAPRV